MKWLSFGAAALVVVAACGNSSDSEPTNNGVADVKKACEIRTTWKRLSDQKCIYCISSAPNEHCDCESIKEFSGACKAQGDNWHAECPQPIIDCANKCANDCNCLAACYAQNAECQKRGGQLDGCVADRCAEYCN